ncbi:UNVERIFIED_CONTAM: hypothetical protein HDU68_009679 [Siphonaria sp. JEL0065]|nr:hypothetical protein HDU68_009679 [Siphonaria sp. JEL0065]
MSNNTNSLGLSKAKINDLLGSVAVLSPKNYGSRDKLVVRTGSGSSNVVSARTIIGLVIASIPQLRAIFKQSEVNGPEAPISFLFEVLQFLGNAAVPLGLMNLGAALGRLDIRSLISYRVITGITICRLVVMPILGIVVVEALVAYGVIDATDKMLRFVLMLEACMPTASSTVYFTQMWHPKGEANAIAGVILVEYMSVAEPDSLDDLGPLLVRNPDRSRKPSVSATPQRVSVAAFLKNGRRLTHDIIQAKVHQQQLTDAMLLQIGLNNDTRPSHVFHNRTRHPSNTHRKSTIPHSKRNSFMHHRPSFFYKNSNPEANAIYVKTLASDHNLTEQEPSQRSERDFELPDEIDLRRTSWKPPKFDAQALQQLTSKYFDDEKKVVVEFPMEGVAEFEGNPKKLSKILKKRVHEAFMADFWALQYHYPKENHPKPGNGITRPPPSAKLFKLTPSDALELSKRTKVLAKPKYSPNGPRVNSRPNTSPEEGATGTELFPPVRSTSAKPAGIGRRNPATAAEAVQSSTRFLESLGHSVKLDKLRIGSAGKRALESKIGRRAIRELFDIRSLEEPGNETTATTNASGKQIIPKLNKKATVTSVYQRREAKRLEEEEKEKKRQVRASVRQSVYGTARQSVVTADNQRPSRASVTSVKSTNGKPLELPQILTEESQAEGEKENHQQPKPEKVEDGTTRINMFSMVPKLLRFNFDAVVNGLKKPFSMRSEEEAAVIRICLKPLKAFRSIQSDILFDQLCQTFRFLEFPKGHTVFKQGDYGDAWYIILFGAVNICVATDSSMTRNVVVQVNNAGESFGDMALVNRAPRLATVVAKTDIMLLKVEKSDFEKISSFTHQIQKRQIRHFLRRYVPLFQRVTDSGIRTVSEHVILKSFTDKTVILEEEGCLNDVFIIQTGVCKVYRNLIIGQPPTKKVRRVFVGTLSKGCHFNDQIIVDPRNINGAPFTVIADGSVECATIIAVGDWVNLPLHHPLSSFTTLKQNDLVKIVMQDEGQRKFQSLQRRLLLEIAKEQRQNPNAVVDDIAYVATADTRVKWRY